MVEYHADDYGLFVEQSKRILTCITDGACNGVSIMPNSPYLGECMKMLEEAGVLVGSETAPAARNPGLMERVPGGSASEQGGVRRVRITVHLNLVEGRALCAPDQVPLLTDDKGIFRIGFGKLFLGSYLPGRTRLRRQICREFRAQIRACLPYMPADDVRLDSHTHTHMAPVVFDAMMDAAAAENLQIANIRIPAEVPSIYRKHRSELTDQAFINRIKVLVLNFCARRNLRKYKNTAFAPCLKNPAVFAGVMCSGRMNPTNVSAIRADLEAEAAARDAELELLFPPGAVYEPEDIAQITLDGDREFLTDRRRDQEAESLIMLAEA